MCRRLKKCEVQQKSQPLGQPSPAKIIPVRETGRENCRRRLTMSGWRYGMGLGGSPRSLRKYSTPSSRQM